MKSFAVLVLRFAAAFAALLAVSPAQAYETDLRIHDPSTIVKSGGTYWVYGTGRGVPQFSSNDRVHWKYQGQIFAQAPAWVAEAVPGNRGNSSWAPDLHFFGGLWHLYYLYSTMGSKVSGIGVVTNKTLDPKGWADQGLVMRTGDDTTYNALDPCIFPDADGNMWLSFGSYFSGIKLISIDTATGKSAPNATVYSIAARPNALGNIEASAVTYHDGYYYLFVDWDRCCAGAKSSYNIRMGRSKVVTGPYLDKDGKDMQDAGGTLFLDSVYDNGTGRLCDDEVGPGHVGILHDTDGDWVSFHMEWARDTGAPMLNVNKLAWDGDGWPRVVLDAGPYKIVANLATHDLASVAGDKSPGAPLLHTWPDQGGRDQRWTLAYQADGYYGIIGAASRKALTVAETPAHPGTKLTLDRFTKRDAQLWLLRQNDDGTYTLLPKSGSGSVALDVTRGAPSDGAPLGLAGVTGQSAQEWSFHTR